MRHDRHFRRSIALLLVLLLTAVSSGAAFAGTETAQEWMGTEQEESFDEASYEDLYEEIPEATEEEYFTEEVTEEIPGSDEAETEAVAADAGEDASGENDAEVTEETAPAETAEEKEAGTAPAEAAEEKAAEEAPAENAEEKAAEEAPAEAAEEKAAEAVPAEDAEEKETGAAPAEKAEGEAAEETESAEKDPSAEGKADDAAQPALPEETEGKDAAESVPAAESAEKEAEEAVQEEKEKYLDKIEALKPLLKGKTALVALGSGYVFEMVRMLQELGMEAVHAVSYHYDPLIDATKDRYVRTPVADVKELGMNVSVTVNNAQQMETYLAVKKYKPDIVITRAHGAGCWSAYAGVPCLDPGLGINIIGYRGLYLFADALVAAFRNTAVCDALKKRYQSPFTDEFEALEPGRFYSK